MASSSLRRPAPVPALYRSFPPEICHSLETGNLQTREDLNLTFLPVLWAQPCLLWSHSALNNYTLIWKTTHKRLLCLEIFSICSSNILHFRLYSFTSVGTDDSACQKWCRHGAFSCFHPDRSKGRIVFRWVMRVVSACCGEKALLKCEFLTPNKIWTAWH